MDFDYEDEDDVRMFDLRTARFALDGGGVGGGRIFDAAQAA